MAENGPKDGPIPTFSSTVVIGSDFDWQTPALDGLHRPIQRVDALPGDKLIGFTHVVINIRGDLGRVFHTIVPVVHDVQYFQIQEVAGVLKAVPVTPL